MKKIICVLIVLLTSISAFSQISNLDKRISELKASGVDTLITYHPYCVGCFRNFDLTKRNECQSFDQKYLVWIKNGKNYIQLFNECYTYNPIPDKMNGFVELFTKHISQIEKEKLKPVQYVVITGNKKDTTEVWIDHTGHFDFDFYIANTSFKKGINSFDLNTEFHDNYFRDPKKADFKNPVKEPNINYSYNQKTYLKQLIDIAEKTIAQLNFQR